MCDGGSSAYIFTKKRTPSEENFNNYARILTTPIVYRGTTLEVYKFAIFNNLTLSFIFNNSRNW